MKLFGVFLFPEVFVVGWPSLISFAIVDIDDFLLLPERSQGLDGLDINRQHHPSVFLSILRPHAHVIGLSAEAKSVKSIGRRQLKPAPIVFTL